MHGGGNSLFGRGETFHIPSYDVWISIVDMIKTGDIYGFDSIV